MPTDQGFHCSHCDQHHGDLPLSYGAPAPAYWHDGLVDAPGNLLTEEQRVIGGEQLLHPMQ